MGSMLVPTVVITSVIFVAFSVTMVTFSIATVALGDSVVAMSIVVFPLSTVVWSVLFTEGVVVASVVDVSLDSEKIVRTLQNIRAEKYRYFSQYTCPYLWNGIPAKK